MTLRRDAVVAAAGAVLLVVVIAAAPPARAAARGFFDSLRLAKPQPVSAVGASAPASSRGELEDAVAGILARAPVATLDEPERAVPSADSAARFAAFTPKFVGARTDAPVISILGARDLAMRIDRAQLRTILDEAGERGAAVPAAIDGDTLRLHAPRGVRLQYGHCPGPVAQTIQGQLQGPPPPSTDYGDCVILIQRPKVTIAAPPALDMPRVLGIALELAGMSPNQAQAFQARFDVPTALALSLPRFMRSYDTLTVNGGRAMQFNMAGRRGPTYAVAWARDTLVYLLSGYGNPGEAATIAASVR